MTALRKQAKRPHEFTTYTEVEVNIDAEELEKEGWVYVGKDSQPTTESVLDIVRLWHDDAHEGPWQWFPEQPCDTIRGREPNGAY